jgi:hypothetical protein
MEEFDEPPKKQFGRTGLILLFAEKLLRRKLRVESV